MVNDAQSTGRERTDLPDIGCEFLENRREVSPNPKPTGRRMLRRLDHRESALGWPMGSPKALGKVVPMPEDAIGAMPEVAAVACTSRNFLHWGSCSPIPLGGDLPGMKSGTGPSTIPHHPGSPRSQSRSRLASMTLGGDMPYNSLVLFISRVPEYEVPSGPNLVHPLDGGRMGCWVRISGSSTALRGSPLQICPVLP